MTEDEARVWIERRFGATGLEKMGRLVHAVTTESERQNLIARSTLDRVWSRHIVDSAQLIDLVGPIDRDTEWLDIGSGAGFPGLVVASLTDCSVRLVEPRKKRAAFLSDTAKMLGISSKTTVMCATVEKVTIDAAVISARAVGRLDDLFRWAHGSTMPGTHWVLPRGRNAHDEVEIVKRSWHGTFHVEHSITDPGSLIVLASGVKPR